MLSAIKELANNRPDEQREHLAVLEYLQACNLIFEEGILSEKGIHSLSSPPLLNMKKGYTHFVDWKEKLSLSKGGM